MSIDTIKILDFPFDVLEIVNHHLDSETRARFGQVCRLFRTIVVESMDHINFSSRTQITDAQFLQATRIHAGNLRSIFLGGCHLVSGSAISTFLNISTNILMLDIRGCREVSNAQLFSIANHCPNIQFLALGEGEYKTCAGFEEIAKKCRSLHTLIFREMGKSSSSFCNLKVEMPSVTVLSFEKSKGMYAFSIVNVIRLCPNVKTLIIQGSSLLNDLSLQQFIERCSQISYLEITNCIYVTAKGIEDFIRNYQEINMLFLGGHYTRLRHQDFLVLQSIIESQGRSTKLFRKFGPPL